MTFRSQVKNGVIVFPPDTQVPDGSQVEVRVIAPASQPQGQSIWMRLSALGKSVEAAPCDLLTDLAANHDHYLHGLPKHK